MWSLHTAFCTNAPPSPSALGERPGGYSHTATLCTFKLQTQGSGILGESVASVRRAVDF